MIQCKMHGIMLVSSPDSIETSKRIEMIKIVSRQEIKIDKRIKMIRIMHVKTVVKKVSQQTWLEECPLSYPHCNV